MGLPSQLITMKPPLTATSLKQPLCYNGIDVNSPLLAGDLHFFALSPTLPLWYLNLPLFTPTNIKYNTYCT